MSEPSITTAPSQVPARPQAVTIVAPKSFEMDDLQRWHQEVDVTRHKVTKFAKLVLLLVFCFGTIWGATAELGGAIIAQGQVITEGRNRVLQNLEGGILAELLVREGDTVAKGQVVARLDTTASTVQLDALDIRRAILRIQLARRQAAIANLDQLVIPSDIPARVLADPRVQETVSSQKSEFLAAQDFIRSQIQGFQTQIENTEADTRGQQQVLAAVRKQEALTRDMATGLQALHARDGTVSLRRVNEELSRLYGLEARIEEIEVTIEQNNGRIREFLNRQQQVRLELLQVSERDAVQLQKELNEVEEAAERLRDRISRAEIRSPVDGTVFQIVQRTLGAVFRPGETIMEVFPRDDRLRIEAKVSAGDVGDAYVGQEVKVQFGRIYSSSPVRGRVIYVSSDAVFEERNPEDKGQYIVRAELNPDELPDDYRPSATAQVYLQKEPKTFFQFIAGPFSRLEFNAFKD